MRVKQKEPDQTGRTRATSVWSGQAKGGPRILVGSALVVNSGPFSSQSGLDMAPIYCGPGRGRGGEKKANITEPAPGGLELAVIYPMAHVKAPPLEHGRVKATAIYIYRLIRLAARCRLHSIPSCYSPSPILIGSGIRSHGAVYRFRVHRRLVAGLIRAFKAFDPRTVVTTCA